MIIYIIEDDTILSQHFTRTLERHTSHTIHSFTNGVDAIASFDSAFPDIIILDILLDGPTGFTLLNELQSYADTAQIPIIICTSIADTFANSDLSSYGVRQILDKTTMLPLDLVEAVNAARL